MGCIWSRDVRCRQCGRKAVNSAETLCALCITNLTRLRERERVPQLSYHFVHTTNTSSHVIQPAPRAPASVQKRDDRPLFGEYRCPCGRHWNSRLSWGNNYQVCKRCRRKVNAHKQRALKPSDRIKEVDKLQEHPKELCQKCQSLGHYCGKSITQHRQTYN